MINQKSLLRPLIELTLASVFWGFGFVAIVWALPFLSPVAIVAYRFMLAFIIGLISFLFTRPAWPLLKNEFKLSAFAGLGLGLCLFLQTVGLQYTSAINSSFITTLYVIFVPFIARLVLNEKIFLFHWVCVFFALIGTGLIVNLGFTDLNLGDLLTLICAVIASIQIVYISWIANRSNNPFVFNTLQSLWAGAPFILVLGFESNHLRSNLFSMDARGWFGMLALTLGSTVLAFYLQIKAQKQLGASFSSLLYLLESPLSCLFAVLLLNEKLQRTQTLGALLILSSCLLATWLENKKRTTT